MATIEQAIKAINPDAGFRSEPADDANAITWKAGTTPISVEDLEAKKAELQVVEDALAISEVSDKASGNQKLVDLGLTQAEINSLLKKQYFVQSHKINELNNFIAGWYIAPQVCKDLIDFFETSENKQKGKTGS